MRNVLLTAGATRNPIDAMRFISARATGGTGLRLAEVLTRAGAEVHLLGSPEACISSPEHLSTEAFGSTRDLLERMHGWVTQHPGSVVIHSAAVGDYESDASDGKIASGSSELLLRLKPTPKILDQVRGWDPSCTLISFKAAAPRTPLPDLEAIARRQLERSQSQLVFGNIIGSVHSNVVLVDPHHTQHFFTREEGLSALEAAVVEVL